MKVLLVYVLLIFASFQLVFAQVDFRKPAIELFVDGKMYPNGSEITVQKGQLLEIKAIQEGGRRDFVKFPDNFRKIITNFQVLSRSFNRIVYLENNVRSEWKLLSEDASFSSDQNLTINKSTNQSNMASVRVGIGNFSQTYLKIELTTVWQYTSPGKQEIERNHSSALVFLNVAGATDTWFVSKNIHASGMRNDLVKNKLETLQSNFDTIESKLLKLDYSGVQPEIRMLQQSVNSLNEALTEIKESNFAYNVGINFVGLPSDRSIMHLNALNNIHEKWESVYDVVSGQLQLIENKENLNNEELLFACRKYLDWQYSLPENWLLIFATYLPQINTEQIILPSAIESVLRDKEQINENTCQLLQSFLKLRLENISIEKQQIAHLRTKIQAVKLFDGMLRSYISSINWANWENTREMGYLTTNE